ncbi:Plasmodesmata callose-binding protein 3 [Cinnamomum micranthum f. kanehirae]|uniref:Plasmodesmata callose-binding protein 3 n=1 Tax=Cinnamomum micranthum f. kanehirae TaxID=337451 RepID=A0A3S3QCL1_9MAGN|nr:Plasmodesmata callose-binding protein 3 [Cinnamomum micranthum f. kanehirae]
MASLVLLLLILAMANGSGATWCICRSDLSDTVLQKTLDYACGAGADCTPILQNGVCYQPNTVKAHCSYAANSYFQRKGQAQDTCDFANTTLISTTDPSPSSTCVFPSSASTTNTSTSTPTATPTGGTTTPSTTIGGSTGMSPSGLTDINSGAFHEKAEMGLIFIALWLSGLVLLRV